MTNSMCPFLKENGVPHAQAAVGRVLGDGTSVSLEELNRIRELCWKHCPIAEDEPCWCDIERRRGRRKNVVTT